jgi:hypothetical protein
MPSVVHQADQSNTRLSDLGLNQDFLRDAVQRGEAERATCTDNDPQIYSGMVPWAKTVRALREALIPLGWRPEEPGNLPLIVNAEGTVGIAVSRGDGLTGVASGSPQTQHPKGPVTVAVVESNQLSLFGQAIVAGQAEPAEPRRVTWILLIANCGNEIRCELSLPDYVGEDMRVTGWAERIILEPIILGDVPAFSPAEAEPEISVEVARRTAGQA